MQEFVEHSTGKHRGSWRPVHKPLTPEEQARVLAMLRQLETAAMFTPRWREIEDLVSRAEGCARRGTLMCADVLPLAEAFRAFSIQ